MRKRIYLLLGLCLALAVFMPNSVKEVRAEDSVLGDLTGDSAVTTDDKTAFENYLLGIENETTTENIANANVNGVEDETAGAMTDVRDLVRYERYLYLKDAAENATNHTLSGSGTSASPYLIENVEDLYCYTLKNLSDTTTYYFDGTSTSKQTCLTTDLEVNVGTGETSTWDATDQLLYPWTPIGTSSLQFAETFNGLYNDAYHTISGLYCEKSTDYTGFIGYSNNANAYIKNLAITNSCFKGTKYVGGIVGRTAGECSNIFCDAYISATGVNTGGIVGGFYGTNVKTIKNCWFAGTINTQNTVCGGIVGIVENGSTTTNNQKSIVSCLYTGEIISTYSTARNVLVGGIVGQVTQYMTNILIQDCLSIGSITTYGDNVVGAIAGRIGTTAMTLTIEDVYSACALKCTGYDSWNSGTTVTGVGQRFNSETNKNEAAGDIDGITVFIGNETYLNGYGGYRLTKLPFVDGRTEYDVDDETESTATWVAVENSHPILKIWKNVSDFANDEYYSSLNLDSSMSAKASIDWYINNLNADTSLYTIADEEDLWGLNLLANTYHQDFSGKSLELSQSITITSDETWTPLLQNVSIDGTTTDYGFKGQFNGNENFISGLNISSSVNDVGFFAEIKHGSTVHDFKLLDCTVSTTSSTQYVGSIAGQCGGNIYNVYSNANIVSSGMHCGGIAGILTGTSLHKIENAWFNGNITTSAQYCGGIVGRITMGPTGGEKLLNNCINSGTITSTKSSNTNNYLGGLCGGVHAQNKNYEAHAVFSECLNVGTIQTTITAGVGSIVGCVTNGTQSSSLELKNVYTTDVVKCLKDEIYEQLTGDTLDALYAESVWGVGDDGTGTVTIADGYELCRVIESETFSDYAQQIPNSDFTWSVSDDDADGIYTVTYSAVEATE